MFFLIEYDRRKGSIVQSLRYDDASRKLAEDDRLKLEFRLKREGIEHEVVVLDAPSEEAIRHTHSRYFESVAELVRSLAEIQSLPVLTPHSPLGPERY